VDQALELYEDFRSTPREGGRMAESGLGHSMWRGPEQDAAEEEGVTSFSFPTDGLGV